MIAELEPSRARGGTQSPPQFDAAAKIRDSSLDDFRRPDVIRGCRVVAVMSWGCMVGQLSQAAPLRARVGVDKNQEAEVLGAWSCVEAGWNEP